MVLRGRGRGAPHNNISQEGRGHGRGRGRQNSHSSAPTSARTSAPTSARTSAPTRPAQGVVNQEDTEEWVRSKGLSLVGFPNDRQNVRTALNVELIGKVFVYVMQLDQFG